MGNIEDIALKTYVSNLEYLKQNHNEIYKKVELFQIGVESNIIKEKFELRYQNNYFDIFNIETNEFIYNTNSVDYSFEIAKKTNDFAFENSFKTYIANRYEKDVVDNAKNFSIESDYRLVNAPIINYFNENTDKTTQIKKFFKFIFFGTGLGIHLLLIHKKINSHKYLIIEPNLEIFRLSLFVTDYCEIGKKSLLYFSIAETDREFKSIFSDFYGIDFVHNHILKISVFNEKFDSYFETIQNYIISQPHYTYSYNRYFEHLRRNIQYLKQNYNFFDIKIKKELSPNLNVPFLFLAAGPSLEKNIDFIKLNQNKFIIVAIQAILPILEKNQIIPDIITQVDEADLAVQKTFDNVQNLQLFTKSIYFYGTQVNKKFVELFPKENMFLFQTQSELKKKYGSIQSPSIGDISYGLLLNLKIKEIYLIGLDMGKDSSGEKIYSEGHGHSFNNLKSKEESSINNYMLYNNTISVPGNFVNFVDSTPFFRTCLEHIVVYTDLYKDDTIKVYNLSDGAKIYKTIPLKASDVDIQNFKNLDKEIYKGHIKKYFYQYSSTCQKEDIDNNDFEINLAMSIKKELEIFLTVKKYSNEAIYINELSKLLNNLLTPKIENYDLQKYLIKSFIMHNVTYIYFIFNIKGLGNYKKHIKFINKNFIGRMLEIIDKYIEIKNLLK